MGRRIFIADDASFMRMMLRDILTKAGYEVCGEAADGAEAVEQCRMLKPEMVLMDIVMPSMDGIYALQKIKEEDAGVTAVMVSALGQARIVADALISGAADFVIKPFQADGLLESVAKNFDARREYNMDTLKKIRDGCAGSNYIISQAEADEIKRAALTDNGNAGVNQANNGGTAISEAETKEAGKIDALIKKLNGGAAVERGELRGFNEKNNGAFGSGERVMSALDAIAKGQEEIKGLLKKLIES